MACIAISQIISDPHTASYFDYTTSDQKLTADAGDARRPPADQSVCRKANTQKEYELCQAWRSAEGARDAADTAWIQFLVSIFGLLGLIWTVYYTKKAADGARKAAEVAERALVDLEQPQMFADIVNAGIALDAVGRFTTLGQDQFRYRFRNFGRTPAQMVDITLRYPIEPKPNLPAPIQDSEGPDRTLPTGVVVAENVPYEEPENLRAHYGFGGLFDGNTTPRTHRLFVVGRFRYASIFQQRFTVGFCFVFDPTYCRWVQTGDNQRYNYTRKQSQT